MCIGMGCLYGDDKPWSGCCFETRIDDDGTPDICWFDGLRPEDFEYIDQLNRDALSAISGDEEDSSN